MTVRENVQKRSIHSEDFYTYMHKTVYIYSLTLIFHLLPRFLGPAPQATIYSVKPTNQMKALPAKQHRVQLLFKKKKANLSS